MATSSSLRKTLSADLMACLGQEDMTDVHLLGTDGVKVPAFRTILACRSDVFRKMLFGNFEESTSNVVKLGYSSEVLGAVVEFCVTDNVLQFDGRAEETEARGTVQLIACAHFLNMPLLQEKARASAKSLLEADTSLACAIYGEASLFGEPTESSKLDALEVIRKLPDDALLTKSSVVSLAPEALGALIGDEGMECEEITLFRALNEWATAGSEFPAADRMAVARDLAAALIRLPLIQPTDLVGIVRKSSFVDKENISEAFEAQALLAEKDSVLRFAKRRKVAPAPGITVSGAGTAVVNGFYLEDGKYEDSPKYTKKCLWEGEERTFCLYRYQSRMWYLSIVGKDQSIGRAQDDFYKGLDQANVPFDGWEETSLGSEPGPKCHKFLGNDACRAFSGKWACKKSE